MPFGFDSQLSTDPVLRDSPFVRDPLDQVVGRRMMQRRPPGDVLALGHFSVRELPVLPNYSYVSLGTSYFVPIHGSASKFSTIAETIEKAFEKTIQQKKVTYDLERLMPGATKLKTSEFGRAIVENM